MSFDFHVKIATVAFSLFWGMSEQAFARRNRQAASVGNPERDQGTFHWITASDVVGMAIAGAFGFSRVGAVASVSTWELAGLLLLLVGIAIRLYAIAVLK